jgi:hypothetical protein
MVSGQIVKRFGRSSPNQERILQAFEEEGWACRIDDPLPPEGDIVPKIRLRDAIRWLNKGHDCRAIHFFGDGTGRGIRWKPAATDVRASSSVEIRRAA